MDEFIEKLPNWVKYLIAIPYAIIWVLIASFIIYISTAFFSSKDSWYYIIVNFLFKNGINVFVFFYALNTILPKYKFQITLTISIIFGILYSILQGMAIMASAITTEYILAFVEFIIALIISCIYSFKGKFE